MDVAAIHASIPTAMGICDQCGNLYDKCFRVEMRGASYTFDSFECAIQKLAPECTHCRCRIIGHGVEADGQMFCCAHCAQHQGIGGMTDRADTRR